MISDNLEHNNPPRWLDPARRAATAEIERFDELAKLLGLNPAEDFRFADLSGVDFRGSILDGFDFTASRLIGCSLCGARIVGAIFDQAELGHVASTIPPVDLTTSEDYDAFAATYRESLRAPTDPSHLPEGAIFFVAPGISQEWGTQANRDDLGAGIAPSKATLLDVSERSPMLDARIINGKRIAERIRSEVAAGVRSFKAKTGNEPGLAIIQVGDYPASLVYARSKMKYSQEVGIKTFLHELPTEIDEKQLLAFIEVLNRRKDIHGILVQLPLPTHIDSAKVICAIDPDKDVDGFHPINVGRLSTGVHFLVPCAPAACIILAKSVQSSLAGLDAVVLGRSNIVGKPLAQLLLAEGCTVTIAHSKSRDLAAHLHRADLVIAAVGRPGFVRGDWIKPGAIVIDAGLNRIDTGDKAKIVGDVAFSECLSLVRAITPVPGGVGPNTMACLLQNVLTAARNIVGN